MVLTINTILSIFNILDNFLTKKNYLPHNMNPSNMNVFGISRNIRETNTLHLKMKCGIQVPIPTRNFCLDCFSFIFFPRTVYAHIRVYIDSLCAI